MRECIKILLHSLFYDMLKKDTTKGQFKIELPHLYA